MVGDETETIHSGDLIMPKLWIAIWTVAVFSSIAWYTFLLFYIGIKAWLEIGQMIRALEARKPPEKTKE